MSELWSYGKSGLVLVAAVGLVAVFIFFRCIPNEHDDPIRQIVADLERRTIPPGANVLDRSDFERDSRSARAAWEIELNGEWSEYCRKVRQQCPDFKTDGPDESKMMLLKQLPGDTLRLELKKVSVSPLRVRITFTGYPS